MASYPCSKCGSLSRILVYRRDPAYRLCAVCTGDESFDRGPRVKIVLSAREVRTVDNLWTYPPPPSAALRRAAETFKELVKEPKKRTYQGYRMSNDQMGINIVRDI